MSRRLVDLEQGGCLLLDGGTGQELAARGVDTESGLWSAQAMLDAPDTLVAVHRDFIDAGADVIIANTYTTARGRLESVGAGARFESLNRRACELAHRARDDSGRAVAIAGSLAPMHGSYRPDRVRPVDELEPQYREQAELLAGYVDVLLCETMSTASEALAAARGAAATGLPVWVSWTAADDGSGTLRSGEAIADAIAALADERVDAVLVNCSMPESVDGAMPALAAHAGRPFGAYANGFEAIPADHEIDAGRNIPGARGDLDPERYAQHAGRWLDAGARLVGGCCEVGPAHIRRLRALLDAGATA